MIPKSNIVHLPVYQPGKPIEEVKKEFGLTEVIKLASNENPFGFSEKAKAAILNEVQHTSLYPDGGAVKLTEALAKHLHVQSNQIIFGAGSDEVILMLARAYLTPNDETIMASHTFPQYKHNAEVEGATCIEVPLVDGKHDLPGMLAKVNARTKIVWICNPNNPTGTMVTHAEVLAFLEQCPKHVIVVLDEAYAEYNTEQDYPDAFALLEQFPNVLVLRTFSKIYGLAALRIGFGVGRPEMIHTINQVREPFNTTRYAQAAALAAIDDQAFIDTCRAQNKAGMEYLEQEIARLGLSSYPSNGNFIMIHVNRPAKLVFEGLLKRGVIVRGGHSLDFPTSIRVTIGSPEQNQAFIETLEVVLAEVEVGV